MDEDGEFTAAIQNLTAQGIINGGDVRKLQLAGINSCNGLMMHTKENLTGITGLSEAKVEQIWEAAEQIVARAGALFPPQIDENAEKTRRNTAKRATMTTYLMHVGRINRLITALALNGIIIETTGERRIIRGATVTAGFKTRQWERELAASKKIVKNIEANGF
ncbi:unnamed protein product [Thlaspi arvense]|uniref:Uncharacterized protein n=1 Tax=Thlaspi arvense TaxID=13288 RepID=A0AAU9S1W5_THLAR|nr:unnamed protein product [Thlaspi arvense]